MTEWLCTHTHHREYPINCFVGQLQSPTCGFRPRHEICYEQWTVSRNVCHFRREASRVSKSLHWDVCSLYLRASNVPDKTCSINPGLRGQMAREELQQTCNKQEAQVRNEFVWSWVTETFGCACYRGKPSLSSPLNLPLPSQLVSGKDLLFVITSSSFGIISGRYMLKYVFDKNQAFTQMLFL